MLPLSMIILTDQMSPNIPIPKELNDLSYFVLKACFKVHSYLGPGLLESCYLACLSYELKQMGIDAHKQVPVPIKYKELEIRCAYKIDLLVNEQLILELKSVESLAPVHEAQLLTYMKLADIRLGLLINFHEKHLKNGIMRRVM